jgi:hypothetical protein
MYTLSTIFFLWVYSPNLGLSRRTVSRTPWTGDQLLARLLLTAPGDCVGGEIGGMNGVGWGNRSTQGKPAPAQLCPPQISLEQTRARTRAAATSED